MMDHSDEFGDEYSQYDLISTVFNYGKPFLSRYTPHREQRRAYHARLAVVLVCQVWYTIGIEFLWSHLVLSRESWEQRSTNWISSLEPNVWTYVRRLDITFNEHNNAEDTSIDSFQTFLQDQVFPHLTRIQVLCAPHSLATGVHSSKPKIIFLYPGGQFDPDPDDDTYFVEGCFRWDIGNHFWTRAQILDLDFELTEFSEEQLFNCRGDIIFQHLKRLCIRSVHMETIVSHITSHWKAPELQFLSLRVETVESEIWIPLLEWAKETLTILHISAFEFDEPDLPSGDSFIVFPVLESLFIERCFYTNWIKVIGAPLLTQLYFCDSSMDQIYRRDCTRFAEILTLSLSYFPLCTLVVSHKTGDTENDDRRESPGHSVQPTSHFKFNPTNDDERALAIRNSWLLAVGRGG